MQKRYEWHLDIKTISEANSSEHWSAKHKRHRLQKKKIMWHWLIEKPEMKLPCKIKLSRVAPRLLDDDNLLSSMKFLRDALADRIHPGLAPGRADDDKRITWLYFQEQGEPKKYSVKIEIHF